MSADVNHTITFFKGPHEVPATTRFEVKGGAIVLNSIQLEDSGMYQISCKVLNGQMGKAKFELQVWSKLIVKLSFYVFFYSCLYFPLKLKFYLRTISKFNGHIVSVNSMYHGVARP